MKSIITYDNIMGFAPIRKRVVPPEARGVKSGLEAKCLIWECDEYPEVAYEPLPVEVAIQDEIPDTICDFELDVLLRFATRAEVFLCRYLPKREMVAILDNYSESWGELAVQMFCPDEGKDARFPVGNIMLVDLTDDDDAIERFDPAFINDDFYVLGFCQALGGAMAQIFHLQEKYYLDYVVFLGRHDQYPEWRKVLEYSAETTILPCDDCLGDDYYLGVVPVKSLKNIAKKR